MCDLGSELQLALRNPNHVSAAFCASGSRPRRWTGILHEESPGIGFGNAAGFLEGIIYRKCIGRNRDSSFGGCLGCRNDWGHFFASEIHSEHVECPWLLCLIAWNAHGRPTPRHCNRRIKDATLWLHRPVQITWNSGMCKCRSPLHDAAMRF